MQSNLGFRESLSTVVTAGLLVLIGTTAVVTAYIYSNQLSTELHLQGQQFAEKIADDLVLDILSGNETDALRKINQFVSWPNINDIAISTPDGELLWSTTQTNAKLIDSLINTHKTEETLWQDWVIRRPINLYVESDDPFLDESSEVNQIGSLVVKMNDGHVEKKVNDLLFLILTAGIIIAALVTILMQLAINRLINPLRAMGDKIERISAAKRLEQIDPKGPREYQNIALVFNEMIKRLAEREKEINEHRDYLEREVALRTKELSDARDQALIASKHKSQFISNVSHELRTPLNSIVGFTELTREALEEDGITKYTPDLEQVVCSSQHLLELINNLLDLAKIEAGKQELHIDNIEINGLVHDVVKSVDVLFRNKSNRATLDIFKQPTWCTTDATKLRQILINLLSNANKFTSGGEIVIQTTMKGQCLSFSVSDHGPGIPADMRNAIFEQFKQTKNQIDLNIQGTGLGLAICKEYTELLCGRIYVDDSYTQGARFTLDLPIKLNKREQISAPYVATKQ